MQQTPSGHAAKKSPLTRLVCGNLISLLLLAWGVEAMGADVEIVGSQAFSNQVRQAVQLLQTRDTNAYSIVTNHVGRIQQGERSGMWAYRTPPTFEMGDRTAFYSLTWCAATIAHDSFHSKLYHDYATHHHTDVPDEIWTGRRAEQQCVQHQLDVMQRIGAPASEIDYTRRQRAGTFVKDKETWRDYQRRNW